MFEDRDSDEPTLKEHLTIILHRFVDEAFEKIESAGADGGELRIQLTQPEWDEDNVPCLQASVYAVWNQGGEGGYRRDPLPARKARDARWEGSYDTPCAQCGKAPCEVVDEDKRAFCTEACAREFAVREDE